MTMTLPSSLDSNRKTKSTSSIKFLYSYGGRIIPRHSDGVLRYVGGFTRVLSVDRRDISFADLMMKFVELCGTSMSLKCKLPKEDLDLLVTIKSDEDLQSIICEYDRDAPVTNIRAVLFPISSLKRISPPCSPMLRSEFTPAINSSSKFACLNLHQPPPPCRTKYLVYPPVQLQNCSAGGRRDRVRDPYCVRHENTRSRPLCFAPPSNYCK